MTPACMIPWISLWPKPNGDVFPCCAVDIQEANLGNLADITLKEAFQSNKMNELRKSFIKGKLDETACKKCIDREAAQGSSMRTMINDQFAHLAEEMTQRTHEDGSVDFFDFRFVDFVWSNKCNFRCVHCNPSVSSAIGSDPDFKNFYMHGHRPTEFSLLDVNGQIMDQFLESIDKVEMIHFNGGEPFMIEEHYSILEHLIRIGRTDVQLWIHTNGSMLQYKGRRVLDYLKHFTNVKLSMSHDGHGSRGEYNRYGYTDKKFLKTLATFREHGFECHASTCVHALNVGYLPEMLDWYEQHNLICGLNVVTEPKHITFNIHDDPTRNAIADKIQAWTDMHPKYWQAGKLNKIVEALRKANDATEETRTKLAEYLRLKQTNLNQSAWEIFPEYREFFETIGWNDGKSIPL